MATIRPASLPSTTEASPDDRVPIDRIGGTSRSIAVPDLVKSGPEASDVARGLLSSTLFGKLNGLPAPATLGESFLGKADADLGNVDPDEAKASLGLTGVEEGAQVNRQQATTAEARKGDVTGKDMSPSAVIDAIAPLINGRPATVPGEDVALPTLMNWKLNVVGQGARVGGSRLNITNAFKAAAEEQRTTPGSTFRIPSGNFDIDDLDVYGSVESEGVLRIANGMLTSTQGLPSALRLKSRPGEEVPIPNPHTFIPGLNLQVGQTRHPDLGVYAGCFVSWLSSDQKFVIRYPVNPNNQINHRDVIFVIDTDGNFWPSITRPPVGPWTLAGTTARAVRAGSPVEVNGVEFLIDVPGGVDNVTQNGRAPPFWTNRPSVTFNRCVIRNETGENMMMGFYAENAGALSYNDCHVFRMGELNLNYAFNSDRCLGITHVGCSSSGGRRSLDGHGSRFVHSENCHWTDGIGGHLIEQLSMTGGTLSTDPPNTAAILMAGGDFWAKGVTIDIPSDQLSALSMRGDIFSLYGRVDLDDCTFNFDCTGAQTLYRSIINLDYGGAAVTHDWGRTVDLPDSISITNPIVNVRGVKQNPPGADTYFTGGLRYINMLSSNPTPPNYGFKGGGRMKVSNPRIITDLPSGLTPSITVIRGTSYNAGTGYDISAEDCQNLQVYLLAQSTIGAGEIANRRHTFAARNVGTLAWQANFGAFSRATGDVGSVNAIGTGRPGSGYATPIGDEVEYIKAAPLTAGFVWDPPNIASGSFATADFTVTGAAPVDTVITTMSAAGAGLPAGMWVEGVVTAADTVRVTLFNLTGSAQNLGSSAVSLTVTKR